MQKIVKLNRAFLYCCMVVLFCLHYEGYAAPTQGKPVSITIKNSSLADVLRQVSKKSGLYIYFQDADLAGHRNVSLDVKNKPVESVLHDLLDERGLAWVEVSENTIAVKKKPETDEWKADVDTVTTITVTGKVVDEKGEPVIGATVMVKNNSSVGTTTNAMGDFTLKGIKANASLVISNVSYMTQEVAVKGRNMMGKVLLKSFVTPLDMVQVQAYGVTNRRISTSNISTVKAEDIEKAPVANPLMAIAGRVPGVFIQQSSGVPGSGVKVLIQGQNSIGYGNDPFYVIDGVPYTSQLLPGLTRELGESGSGTSTGVLPNTNGNPLNFINPQDIESIDILKDADATAIYGSRAANGAILITTKKGKEGKTSVSLNVRQGWGKIARRLNLLNTDQYLGMRREAFKNDGKDIPNAPTFGAFDLTFWDGQRYTDWQKELIGGTAAYSNAMLSVSGGSARTQFLVSGGYQREGTVTPGDLRDQKASVHFNLNNTSENKRFKFGFSGNYVSDDNKLAAINGLVNAAYTLAPNAPRLYNDDGTLNWELLPSGSNSFYNPLNYLSYEYINRTKNLIANANFGYQILPGLDLKGSLGYNNLRSNEIYGNKISQLSASMKRFATRNTEFNTAEISSWIVEPQLVYNRLLGPGKLQFLVGTTIQHENRSREKLNATGFNSDQVIFNIKAATAVVVDQGINGVIQSQYKYNALFSRIGYNISDKYLFNLNVRRDGSSRFGSENRFHNFGSIAGAWVISSEKFLKDRNLILSFLKIRASYGTTGSDQIGDYRYLNLYENTRSEGNPYQGIIGSQPSLDFPNPYLQWEETRKFSATLDIGLLNDALLLNATFYRNVCSNQLLYESLPSITGGGGVNTNLPARVQNTGLELTMNANIAKRNNFNWNCGANLTIPRNIMFEYSGIDALRSEFNGKPTGVFKAYRFLEVDPVTGIYVFADKNGKPTSNPTPGEDQTEFVNLAPSFYGGLQNSLTFKGFSLDVLFQFIKQKGPNGRFGLASPGAYQQNQTINVLDRWQKTGDNATIQKYSTEFDLTDKYNIAIQSDKYFSDASYVRLKNVSMSYQFSNELLKLVNLKNARCFLQTQNIFTFTKFTGVDPETRSFAGLPPLKVITFGVQLEL